MSEELKTWPERIFLQHGENQDVPNYEDCMLAATCGEVTWCHHDVHGNDIEYTRADIAEAHNKVLVDALEAVNLDVVSIGNKENAISDATRELVEQALAQVKK